jgi:SAM-dependent methyltransferase
MNVEQSQQAKWDSRYLGQAPGVPLSLLTENAYLLPTDGAALDLACGTGANALFLAQRGLQTQAWDMSAVAIDTVRRHAGNLPLLARQSDVIAEPPPPATFDVVCVAHFLDRDLCPAITAALRPGGLLFYQTFILDRVDDTGPSSGRYRLESNELLRLFAGLTVRYFREDGLVGDTARGLRNVAQLIAQVPTDGTA